jgi:hydroxymethylbilane synthase
MSDIREIIIGSRGSDLALWQANFVQTELQKFGFRSQIKIIVTKGDRIQHLSFDKIEGKGFFTKEIEDALLRTEIDLAVHSLKDLPTTPPDGLDIAALSYREDPRDLLIIRKDAFDPTEPLKVRTGKCLGTSSARRKVQVNQLQHNLALKDLRGNVPTRIQKCRDGQYDAIILAAAGVNRLKLDLSDFETWPMPVDMFVPAPAQGVLGLQIRRDDTFMREALRHLHHADVAETIAVERELLNMFEGGCHMPVGAYCHKFNGQFELYASKAKSDKELPVKIQLQSSTTNGLAAQALALCNKTRSGSVFISRNADQAASLIHQLSALGFRVEAKSLIQTEIVQATTLPESDWLFFVSRNAVRHFFSQFRTFPSRKIAAVGAATASELYALGHQPDFIGASADLNEVATTFTSLYGRQSVCFPIGNRSKRSIQQGIENVCQVFEIQVYETLYKAVKLSGQADINVFTSPSCFEAFLRHNQLSVNSLVVAMGATTAEAVRKHGHTNLVVPSGFRADQIAMAIFSHT